MRDINPLYNFTDSLLFSNSAQILMYHGFTVSADNTPVDNYHGKHLSSELFEKQCEYLKKHFTLITLEKLVDCIISKEKIPPRSVVLTFDDGFKSNYQFAYPILRKYNIPATIFISTGFIENIEFLWPDRLEYSILHSLKPYIAISLNGKSLEWSLKSDESKMETIDYLKKHLKSVSDEKAKDITGQVEEQSHAKLSFNDDIPETCKPLDWSEIKEMLASGLITIGSHTHTHPILSRCPDSKVQEELKISKDIIEKNLGSPCSYFCYPNGAEADFNETTKKLIKEAGYKCALSTINGAVGKGSDLYALHRTGTADRQPMIDFALSLSQSFLTYKGLRNSLVNSCSKIKRSVIKPGAK